MELNSNYRAPIFRPAASLGLFAREPPGRSSLQPVSTSGHHRHARPVGEGLAFWLFIFRGHRQRHIETELVIFACEALHYAERKARDVSGQTGPF